MNSFFVLKYLTSFGFKEILLGFSFKLRTLKMKLLEKDSPSLSVLLMITLYWDFSSQSRGDPTSSLFPLILKSSQWEITWYVKVSPSSSSVVCRAPMMKEGSFSGISVWPPSILISQFTKMNVLNLLLMLNSIIRKLYFDLNLIIYNETC